MSDIAQPASVPQLQRRLDGRSQGGGRYPDAPPAKKVVETYQEIDRTKPVDDRITILGIPAEQITPATHAALASLVGEINFLRARVRRLERDAGSRTAVHEPSEAAFEALAAAFAAPVADRGARVLVLAYLNTFEDVRRSSGLLAAKGLLFDVFARFSTVKAVPQGQPVKSVKSQALSVVEPSPVEAPGLIGGAAMAGIFRFADAAVNETAIAQQVRDALLLDGFVVAGIEMAVSLTVGTVAIGDGESLLTALGRVDHMIRGSAY
jgi:hypothetical protein